MNKIKLMKKCLILISFIISSIFLFACSGKEKILSEKEINLYFMNDDTYFKQAVFKKEYQINNDNIDDVLLDFLASYFYHIEYSYPNASKSDLLDEDTPNVSLYFKKENMVYEKVFLYSDIKLTNKIEKDKILNYDDIYVYYYHPYLNNFDYDWGTNNVVYYYKETPNFDKYSLIPDNVILIKDFSQIFYYIEIKDELKKQDIINLFKKYLKVENNHYINYEKMNIARGVKQFDIDYNDELFEIYEASFVYTKHEHGVYKFDNNSTVLFENSNKTKNNVYFLEYDNNRDDVPHYTDEMILYYSHIWDLVL